LSCAHPRRRRCWRRPPPRKPIPHSLSVLALPPYVPHPGSIDRRFPGSLNVPNLKKRGGRTHSCIYVEAARDLRADIVPVGEGGGSGVVLVGVNENIALEAATTLLSQIVVAPLLSKVSYRIVNLFINIYNMLTIALKFHVIYRHATIFPSCP
jgi:hypothetical protein